MRKEDFNIYAYTLIIQGKCIHKDLNDSLIGILFLLLLLLSLV